MARHSKNNTALGFFTYDEKKKAQYGTKKQRLGKDSMRRFDSCYLCLQKARVPLSCSRGHISCRECTVEHLVSQKASLLRQSKLAANQAKADQEAAKIKSREEESKKLLEFEKLQSQVTSVKAITLSNTTEKASLKRDFNSLKEEKSILGGGYSNSCLPSFWVPALTPAMPTSKPISPVNTKLTQCTAAEPHTVSMKKLISVNFSFGKENAENPICPACMKNLSNALNPIMMVHCGHVFCSSCTTKFIKPTNTCYTCQKSCPEDTDKIKLHHDGTGFASGGGKVETSRFNLAFQ